MLSGESHGVYRVGASIDLLDWSSIATNTGRASHRELEFPCDVPQRFFRAQRLPAPRFHYALAAYGRIDTYDNNLAADSFNSSDPRASTKGHYDPTKCRDQAEIATNSGLANSLDVGNAIVKGFILTGPGGSIYIGPTGSAGSLAWIDAFNKGIQPGHTQDDCVLNLPNIQPPVIAEVEPIGGIVDGQFYDYLLGDGNYRLENLVLNSNQRLGVSGHAILFVSRVITLTDSASLQLFPGTSLQLYVGESQSTPSDSAFLGGLGVINPGPPDRFQLYALPSITSLIVSGSEPLSGLIHAANASITLGGSGSGTMEFSRSCLGRQIVLNGHLSIHYDENLLLEGPVD